MTTFVLVPGFWLGAWAWRSVARSLRAAGHEAFPMTLTGLADRSHLASPEVGLDTHVTDIVQNLRYEELTDVVLVGHSGGGMAVTMVADQVPERLRRVIYVDSGPLPDGMAQIDFNPPEAQAEVRAQIESEGEGWRVPVPAFDPEADPVNLAGLDEAALRRMRALGTPQPARTSTDPVRLRGEGKPVPATVVLCTMPTAQAKQMLGTAVEYAELPTGHWPMFSRPAELADLLVTIGAGDAS